ncbi:MAG: NAD-dependent epimerase/dehydratase family protein [Crocinitomicaceae bacterium]|nr:NAD-dependent epimerase/dehydratase family protein [Crocinitomicaceae bacterium]
MKIALTGCTGHIGYNLSKALLAQGHQLNLLVRGNARPIIGENVHYFKGDLNDKDALNRMMEGVDYVYHLAARIGINGETEEDLFPTNVQGVQNILDAFEKSSAKRLIHFSSIHAYQQLPRADVLDESRPLVTKSLMVYDRSKSKGQQLVVDFVKRTGREVIILNPTAVFGPEDKFESPQGKAVSDLYKGKIPAVMNYGFNWVDVRDIIQGAMNAMTKGRSGESYILGGTYKTVKQMAQAVKEAGGKKKWRPNVPIWVMEVSLPLIKLWSKIVNKPPIFTKEMILTLKEGNLRIVSDKAAKELDFHCRPFEETIKDLIEYFKSVGTLK